MGKLKKKNVVGTAKTYVTRNQALKKLQISLADFRRLCILKGIYPHDPKYKKKITGGSGTSSTTFYHVKDIKHLLHEPILEKFRQYKSHAKKVKKLIGKREWSLVKRAAANRPSYSLEHVIKERYPTFQSSLQDLDDALCHLFVFASLPSINGYTEAISKECTRLCHEFQHYILLQHALEKVFLSVKGIYYQGTIRGETVTWLAPYEFSQHVPPNVDFRVMLTFLEFYRELLGFINFKLYKDAGLEYPPAVDKALEEDGVGLMSMSVSRKTAAEEATALSDDLPALDALDRAELPEARALQDRDLASRIRATLFSSLVIYVSREVPKDALIFVTRAFGCANVGWAHTNLGSPFKEDDPRITHHIVDRPVVTNMFMGRKYVQPQWIFDCINQKKLLAEELYAVGVELPPHLSPFVTEEEDEEAEEEEAGAAVVTDEEEFLEGNDLVKAEKNYVRKMRQGVVDAETPQIEAATPEPEQQQQQQLSKDKSMHKLKIPVTKEAKELALTLISKKKRKLYEAMQRGIKVKADEKKRLADKKAKLANKAK